MSILPNSNSNTTNMVSIDSAQYPHIFETILSYTADAELPKWRLVSRKLAVHVGRLMCTHLILAPKSDSDAVTVRAARPAWGDYLPPTKRIPGLRTIAPVSWAQLPRHPALDFTAATRVLDIDGFVPAHVNLSLLAPAFPEVKILRMRTCPKGGYTPYLPVPAHTVVLFTNNQGEGPDPSPYSFDFASEDEDDEPAVIPDGVSPVIPEGTRKLVINMKGNDVPIADLFAGVLDPPKSLRELVIVLPAYRRSQAYGRIPGVFMDHIVVMDTAELLMSYHDEECTITIIGTDEVRPGYNLRAMMDTHIRTRWNFKGIDPDPNSPEKCAKANEILSPVQFVSRMEYIARFGKRVVELETVERL